MDSVLAFLALWNLKGAQDDLVNAIGLAVHRIPSRPWTAADWEALAAALPVSPGAEAVEMLRRATGLPI